MNHKKRILIAPLAWGLGHATRCIPIIRALQYRGYTPLLASDGDAFLLLQKEFPHLKIFRLPSYRIRYESENMIWNMAGQLPRIQWAILQEHRAIKKIVNTEKIDIILSDNRFGCWHSDTKNIFITHQLNIKIPFAPLEKIVAMLNHRLIKKFDQCWVPDFEKESSLAGDLSRKRKLENVCFIGALSRMEIYPMDQKYDLIIVLSGPEPQRTFLEKKIVEQVRKMNIKSLLVRGLSALKDKEKIEGEMTIVPYLTTNKLNDAILSSQVVMCRSGYSSLMDLAALNKQAILIPTPGQTEQEYLANRFQTEGVFLSQKQENLDIEKALKEVGKYRGFSKQKKEDHLLAKALDKLLED